MLQKRLSIRAAAIAIFIGAIALSGLLRPLDAELNEARFRLLDRSPSGELVIVTIDPKSIHQVGRWPWSRSVYAEATRNLFDAGAELIAFDVDFSSLSWTDGDAAFRQQIDAYPLRVVLPEFYQPETSGGVSMARTAPNPFFLDNAIIALANLPVEANGAVLKGWRGSEIEGEFRGSFATVLAGLPSRTGSFLLDYSIDPQKIRYISFIDVVNGAFDPDAVDGKKILIGATALELGDEFAVPLHGLLPGVVLHGLAYESLVQGRALSQINPAATALLAILVFLLCHKLLSRWSWRTLHWHAGVLTLLLGAPLLLQAVSPVMLNTAALLLAQFAAAFVLVLSELGARAAALIEQRLESIKHQALFAMVLRDSSDGVIITDDKGGVVTFNDRACVLLNLDPERLTEARLTDVVPDFPVLCATPKSKECEAAAELRIESNDDTRVLEITGASSFGRLMNASLDGAGSLVNYYSYTMRDITARKNAEDAERAAKEAALAAATFKNRLISTISHELRTPLNSIVGFAGVLTDDTNDERRDFALRIRNGGVRLLGLVNDILQISRLDSGDFTLDPDIYSIREFWEDAAVKHVEQAEAQGKSIDLFIDKGFPRLKVDYETIVKALDHLLSNAIKFTSKGGSIKVTAYMIEGEAACIGVEDDGIGLDPQLLPRLGEAFFQGNSALDRAHEGAGLGLHVAKRCVSLNGGDIEFYSALGEGFVATIKLPLSATLLARAAA